MMTRDVKQAFKELVGLSIRKIYVGEDGHLYVIHVKGRVIRSDRYDEHEYVEAFEAMKEVGYID